MISIEQLMERFNNNKNDNFIVHLGQYEYQCTKLPFKKILSLDDEYDVETQKGAYDRNLEVIYLSCEVFRNLADKLGYEGEPHNVVEKVLSPIEVLTFYTHILNQYMGQMTKDVDNVKK